MGTSLIITTYNWPEALRLVLYSAITQSVSPDEIVIADDGSTSETAGVVKDALGAARLKWVHVRHEDKGVRQSRIKNLAVKHSCGDYLVFVDHDVVLHPRFIEDHISMAQRGTFLQGKRVLLSRYYTEEVVRMGRFNLPRPWTSGIQNGKNAIRGPLLGRVISRQRSFARSLRGCNLSMFRDDFMKVDGFDENFDGSWGREDSDICYRLFHTGVTVRILWFMALQYHLFHGKTEHWDKERLDFALQENLREKRTRAGKGISTISSEGGPIASSHSN